MRIRLLLADDHTIVLDGLRALLEGEPDLEVVGTVSDGREAVRQCRTLRPGVVIMDLSMAGLNGIEAIRQINAVQPEVKLLCLSMHAGERFTAAALDAGASGYVLKDCAADELIRAIHIVIAGHTYLSPAVTSLLLGGYRTPRSETLASAFGLLTQREREVLQLIAEGHTTKVIAKRLSLSVKTIGTHREHLMGKLQAHSVAALVKFAIREGLTSADA